MKIALALAVLSLLSGCIESASEDKNAPFYTYDATSFSCDGKSLKTACGPAYWHTLTGYEACGGMKQSPVNIETASAEIAVGVPQFDAEAGCSEWDQYANDHAFQVDFAKCDSLGVTYEGTYYTLLQFHFHSPSEHTIDGQYFDAELHMVHKGASDDDLLVIGVPLQVMKPDAKANNLFLNRLWKSWKEGKELEKTKVVSQKPLNPHKYFLGPNTRMYSYAGSLTTPPCSETVKWFLRARPAPISMYDLTMLRSIVQAVSDTVISELGNNNRPLQLMNERELYSNIEL